MRFIAFCCLLFTQHLNFLQNRSCLKTEQNLLHTNCSSLFLSSDLVVDVGWTLRRYLLNYIHRSPVFTAHALVVTADHAVRGPQREDDVAAVWTVVTADAVPLRHSQGVEGHGGGLLLPDGCTAALVAPPQHQQDDDDEQEDDRTAGDDPHEESWLRDATGTGLSRVWGQICPETWRRGRKSQRRNNQGCVTVIY